MNDIKKIREKNKNLNQLGNEKSKPIYKQDSTTYKVKLSLKNYIVECWKRKIRESRIQVVKLVEKSSATL